MNLLIQKAQNTGDEDWSRWGKNLKQAFDDWRHSLEALNQSNLPFKKYKVIQDNSNKLLAKFQELLDKSKELDKFYKNYPPIANNKSRKNRRTRQRRNRRATRRTNRR